MVCKIGSIFSHGGDYTSPASRMVETLHDALRQHSSLLVVDDSKKV